MVRQVIGIMVQNLGRNKVDAVSLTSGYIFDSFMLTAKPPPTSDPHSIMLKPNTPDKTPA